MKSSSMSDILAGGRAGGRGRGRGGGRRDRPGPALFPHNPPRLLLPVTPRARARNGKSRPPSRLPGGEPRTEPKGGCTRPALGNRQALGNRPRPGLGGEERLPRLSRALPSHASPFGGRAHTVGPSGVSGARNKVALFWARAASVAFSAGSPCLLRAQREGSLRACSAFIRTRRKT